LFDVGNGSTPKLANIGKTSICYTEKEKTKREGRGALLAERWVKGGVDISNEKREGLQLLTNLKITKLILSQLKVFTGRDICRLHVLCNETKLKK
jgi:hypothetical protein